ncbi:phosphoenolpyruvate--protein phosphotransferase [Shewanella sp. NIFS-20-20]|uniref:phosphoenolpyruvate--protein phosphotransferase n=1 Tax=Shewanella sp. NIFS-20-20 TaxID=2853806 RepID=UPI001C4692E0|nr:phosphoenolpyruvate--protein phosphotransferase [Shewanella sp. NIFS-20-20]MBV7317036.1 phosphoenolpyruvate--protein phosphotransferase [Shewanella sp. NIFS-20-20]
MSQTVPGINVCSGVVFGPAFIYCPEPLQPSESQLPNRAAIAEQQALFHEAIAYLYQKYSACLSNLNTQDASQAPQAQLLDAILLWLEDDEMQQAVEDAISRYQFTAIAAVTHVFNAYAEDIAALDDSYLASRSHELTGLSHRLCLYLRGQTLEISDIVEPVILCCQELTPAEFILLDLTKISGLVMSHCGLTSHTVILARSAGLPTLINCDYLAAGVTNGQAIMLDTPKHCLVIAPEPWRQEYSLAWQQQQQANHTLFSQQRTLPCQTLDGSAITLLTNVGNQADITQGRELGSQGVGLLRTELMFINAPTLEDEERQFHAYCQAIAQLQGDILTVRTLDVGADKPLKAIDLPAEANPALGMRGIRYTLRHQQVLMPQLRALLRAAHLGPIRLMFPMLSQVEELDALVDCINACQQQLTQRQQVFGDVSIGVVIETPAAAMLLHALLPRLSFISIGTNDLNQYLQGADRGHPQLSSQFPALNPALLSLMATIRLQASQAEVNCGICGEIASDPRATALLLGMGFTELSVNIDSLGQIKSNILGLRLDECRTLATQALSLPRMSTLNQCLDNFNQHAGLRFLPS